MPWPLTKTGALALSSLPRDKRVMKRAATVAVAIVTGFAALACAEESQFAVKVSPNGRYFIDQTGKPAFWLGTTQWQLCRDYTLNEAKLIIQKSKEKGFTCVLVMLTGVGDGTKANVHGEKPWLGDNPLTPNEAYFRNVDAVLQAARENNIGRLLIPNPSRVGRRRVDHGNRTVTAVGFSTWPMRLAENVRRRAGPSGHRCRALDGDLAEPARGDLVDFSACIKGAGGVDVP